MPAADFGISNWKTDEMSGLAVPLYTVPKALSGLLFEMGIRR